MRGARHSWYDWDVRERVIVQIKRTLVTREGSQSLLIWHGKTIQSGGYQQFYQNHYSHDSCRSFLTAFSHFSHHSLRSPSVSMDTNPYVRHTFWSTICFGFFFGLNDVAICQYMFQRFASVRSLTISKRWVIVSVQTYGKSSFLSRF